MRRKRLLGHLLCFLTILIWGTTFVSTKILLLDFTPAEILFFRFLLGFFTLCIADPKPMKHTSLSQELPMALAGLSGVTLYYLFENMALTHTTASNVGIIVSTAPFFTVLLSQLFRQGDRMTPAFLLGFFFAVLGIGMITFTDLSRLHVNPAGDLLAILAALLWAVYSLLMKRINRYPYSVLQITRRIFLYGLLFMLPLLRLLPFAPAPALFQKPVNLGNFLYLGIGACAICFAIWNYALKLLGTVTTSVYIYGVPVITLLFSAMLLQETMTAATITGAVLTIVGLLLSQQSAPKK